LTILPQAPTGGVELSFDPIREPWSIYKAKTDGAIIKVRLTVGRIILAGVKEDGSGHLVLGSNLLFSVTSPNKGQPDPSPKTNEQIIAAIVERTVPYDTVKEEWNEYDVEGVVVGLKLVITNIAKTNLFDDIGQPLYYVNWSTVIRPITGPEDRAKLKKIWDERGPKGPEAPKA